MKKFLSIITVMAMVLSLCVTAFAAENKGSITITNATIDETYALYKIFDATINKDADGKLEFRTNIIEGIILRDHVLYYLQEIQPPPAYQLDDTKYWFCFCSNTSDTCVECNKLMIDAEAVRIPFEAIGLIDIANYPANVELPATGGIGTPIYILCGLTLVLGPFVYGFSLRRRYGRRLNK